MLPENPVETILKVNGELGPNNAYYKQTIHSKQYLMLSENSVQIVLLEHSVQTVLNVIRVNREFKPKKTRCYQKIQSKQ